MIDNGSDSIKSSLSLSQSADEQLNILRAFKGILINACANGLMSGFGLMSDSCVPLIEQMSLKK